MPIGHGALQFEPTRTRAARREGVAAQGAARQRLALGRFRLAEIKAHSRARDELGITLRTEVQLVGDFGETPEGGG